MKKVEAKHKSCVICANFSKEHICKECIYESSFIRKKEKLLLMDSKRYISYGVEVWI